METKINFPNNFIAATREYCSYEKYVNAPLLRKSFTLQDSITEASMLVTGLGFYELHINGKIISKFLAPYISAPDDIVYYDKYDIRPYLQKGENVIGLVLGNGMQNAFGGYIWDFHLSPWLAAPCTALRLDITYNNGETLEISTDETFLTSPSPIYFDEMRSGEYYDARLEQDGWNLPNFDASKWQPALPAPSPRGEKRLCQAEPIEITGEMKPISVTKTEDGYRYDFGTNSAGLCRLKIIGTSGQEITLIHGEHLIEKPESEPILTRLDNFQPPGYAQVDKYTCKGAVEETFTPRFTYHGFRYVLIKGITPEQATPELLTYQVMHSNLQERGNFNCSDPVANTLQELTRRSTLTNFHYFPTDCPHREKNGWTGDAAISAEHTLLNLAPENSYREWLRSVCKAQRIDGALPGIVPTGGWGFEWGNGPAWDCVLTYLPFFTYRYRKDKAILEENATGIFRYLHYINRNLKENDLVELGLGDWCPPGKDNAGDYKAPVLLTDSIICMDVCNKAAQIFGVLTWENEKNYAQNLANKLRSAIRKELIDSNMLAAGECQTSQAMALYYGIFNEDEKPTAEAQLLRLIEECGNHMDTGILGARVIFHMLSKMGKSNLAYDMITRPEYPSYGNWLTRGATTLWENFHPSDDGIWSRNHHFFGDISNWFIQCITGIKYNANLDGRCNIAPSFVSKLDFAESFYIAPEGKISVKWTRKTGTEILLEISVPDGLLGDIILEDGWVFDDSGSTKPLISGAFYIASS